MVERAEHWRWSSLRARRGDDAALQSIGSPWPLPGGVPRNWLQRLNRPQTQAELEALRLATNRDRPLGDEHWTPATAEKLGLTATLKPQGSPKNKPTP